MSDQEAFAELGEGKPEQDELVEDHLATPNAKWSFYVVLTDDGRFVSRDAPGEPIKAYRHMRGFPSFRSAQAGDVDWAIHGDGSKTSLFTRIS